MSVFIDVALIITFVLFVISFTKNGFAGTIIRIGKTWISLFFSSVLNPLVSGMINDWFLFRPVQSGINNTLVALIENNPNKYNLSQLFDKLPAGFLGLLRHFGISLSELEAEYGSATEASEQILGDIATKIATPCAKAISGILAYIVCFIASLLFFVWLNRKIKQRRTPFFRFIDGIMGFVIGTAVGACAVFGIVTVIYTVFQIIIVFDASSSVTAVYEGSYVFKYVNELDAIGMLKNLFSSIIGA